MSRTFLVVVCVSLCAVARAASAQLPWTSTDIGSVGIAGEAPDLHTVSGSGADIWGTADAFQFVHVPVGRDGWFTVCVNDLQNTNPFAKAGIVLRSSLDPGAATAILDVKPDGGIEFMVRPQDGAAMQYIGGLSMSFPACLFLHWDGGSVSASAGFASWIQISIGSASLTMPPVNEVGLAVTSHDDSQLARADFGFMELTKFAPDDWYTADVGDVGTTGSTSNGRGTWTVTGAGGDIWADRDAFRYVYRLATVRHLIAFVDDLKAANAFAKAGIMVRNGLDAGAATIVLDVRPGGDIEFMSRGSPNDSMTFLGTANVTFPVWLQLNSQFDNDGTETVVAAYSQDHTHWQTVGAPLKWSSKQFFLAGAVVTSHDTTQTATAHFTGLSLLSNDWSADDIGDTGLVGNASTDLFNALDGRTTVEAAGSDVWGTSDSFYFIHRGEVPLSQPDSVTTRVAALQATDAFAKAGVMYRDGLAADAASVILDVKPDGGIEFMARMCAGCPTTFIAGTSVEFPVWLRLDLRDDGSIAASLRVGDLDWEDFGSVSVPMTTPVPGFAATSHNPGQLATAVFDTPAFEFPLPTD